LTCKNKFHLIQNTDGKHNIEKKKPKFTKEKREGLQKATIFEFPQFKLSKVSLLTLTLTERIKHYLTFSTPETNAELSRTSRSVNQSKLTPIQLNTERRNEKFTQRTNRV